MRNNWLYDARHEKFLQFHKDILITRLSSGKRLRHLELLRTGDVAQFLNLCHALRLDCLLHLVRLDHVTTYILVLQTVLQFSLFAIGRLGQLIDYQKIDIFLGKVFEYFHCVEAFGRGGEAIHDVDYKLGRNFLPVLHGADFETGLATLHPWCWAVEYLYIADELIDIIEILAERQHLKSSHLILHISIANK